MVSAWSSIAGLHVAGGWWRGIRGGRGTSACASRASPVWHALRHHKAVGVDTLLLLKGPCSNDLDVGTPSGARAVAVIWPCWPSLFHAPLSQPQHSHSAPLSQAQRSHLHEPRKRARHHATAASNTFAGRRGSDAGESWNPASNRNRGDQQQRLHRAVGEQLSHPPHRWCHQHHRHGGGQWNVRLQHRRLRQHRHRQHHAHHHDRVSWLL